MLPKELNNVKTIMKDKCHVISPLQKKMIQGIMKEPDAYTLTIDSGLERTVVSFTSKDESVSSFRFPIKKECQIPAE